MIEIPIWLLIFIVLVYAFAGFTIGWGEGKSRVEKKKDKGEEK